MVYAGRPQSCRAHRCEVNSVSEGDDDRPALAVDDPGVPTSTDNRGGSG